ncbi:two-component system, sensor histidine kinase [Methylomarinovum caldicuralii]|uniref:histidine kinase n=1 Tax=Methylomarinovum caldicuralii TaxID=438856 RepID=A0AAU9CN25_9GAMM|nr:ATP-binding protein [Methylomarinovum caldicuralii]BCX80892.1 two-component system, sensor histidine kinase [Methylomarinovum caldicuralii]
MRLASHLLVRVLPLVFGITLTVAGIIGASALRHDYRRTLENTHTLGSAVTALAAAALRQGEAASLSRTLTALAQSSQLGYAAVYDAEGRALVRMEGAPARLDPRKQAAAPAWWQVLLSGQERLPLCLPVFAVRSGAPWQIAGYLELGVSLAEFHRHARHYLGVALLASAAASLLAAGLILWLARRLGRPLQHLASAAAADRTMPPPLPGCPVEIRRLAEALGRLQYDLRQERRARADLEAQVAQRAESLRQMIGHAHTLAQKAEAASQAKSRFLANVSHELRTPLNAILGFMELLLAGELRSETRNYVRLAREAAQALLQLIEDLLDVARIEAGRLELHCRPFDLAALVASVVELHRPLAESKNLSLSCRYPADLPAWRHGDAGRIRQVLSNLVHNAIKFTEWGKVEVTVAGEGDRVRLEVRDTGIGLQAEDCERIFEPFTQVDGGSTRRHGGTGLGLSICRQLVESMGGTISVTSQLHRGSCFAVVLPLPEAPPAPIPAATEAEAQAQCLRGRVLVVEDDRLNRALLTEILKHLGCEAEAVADADALWPRWRRGRYDLVLLDCQLPGVDGFEIARTLRERYPERDTPIVAVTADVSDGIEVRCHRAGMDDCLHKPVTLERLRACLKRWLPEKAALAETAEAGRRQAQGALFDPDTLAQLQRLEAGQAGLLERLLSLFRLQGRQWLQALEQARREGNDARIRQVAHGFRSACVHLGIRDLVAILTELEKETAAADPECLARLWAGYRRVCCLFGVARHD